MNETSSDTKKEPKVTFQKAVEAVKVDAQALVNKALAGFELDADDRKSRKRIFSAIVASAAEVFLNEKTGAKPLSTASLARRATRGIYALQPTNHQIVETDTNDDGDYSDDDDSDNDE